MAYKPELPTYRHRKAEASLPDGLGGSGTLCLTSRSLCRLANPVLMLMHVIMAASHASGFTCLFRLYSCKFSPVTGNCMVSNDHCMNCQVSMACVYTETRWIPPYIPAACLVLGRADSGLLLDVTGQSQLACIMKGSKVNHARSVGVMCQKESAGMNPLHA